MAKTLPTRPHLDHLRRQAKDLLTQLRDGNSGATQAFAQHLPQARRMTPSAIRAAGFRLADAQSVVARQTGFASWPALSRHVQHLRTLEGEWHFTRIEVDGLAMPRPGLSSSRLLIDGDRFRSEMVDAIYDGVFTIDVEAALAHIDIDFIEGPEAGQTCHGIYEIDGDHLTLCLGLVGATRPAGFATSRGSGHALEHLRRASATRPINVTGGTPQPRPASEVDRADPAMFDVEMTPLMRRLEGDWVPVQLVTDGQPLAANLLAFGSRSCVGNEVKVVFGGQVMLHAKVRIDEGTMPIAVDYMNLAGPRKGTVSRGIMEWNGEEARFLMAASGQPRPAGFDDISQGTFSQWRRKG